MGEPCSCQQEEHPRWGTTRAKALRPCGSQVCSSVVRAVWRGSRGLIGNRAQAMEGL